MANFFMFFKRPFIGLHRKESRLIIILFSVLGFTAGYQLLSDGVNVFVKLLFGGYGLGIGLVLGFILSYLVSLWKIDGTRKGRFYLMFIIASVAPCLLIYFDFGELAHSNFGMKIFLIMNLVMIIILGLMTKMKIKSLFLGLFILIIWESAFLDWFISITWKIMNYWD